MIKRQGEIISELNEEIRRLRDQRDKAWDELDQIRPAAFFYLGMQKAIIDNPILQGEWTRFCSFLRMANPDLNDPGK